GEELRRLVRVLPACDRDVRRRCRHRPGGRRAGRRARQPGRARPQAALTPTMGNRLSKIYTRTGDDGTTGLGDGSRVAKDSARVAAYGTVDEANCSIGLMLAVEVPDDVRELLTTVQHQLFDLGGELCIPGHAAIEDADID